MQSEPENDVTVPTQGGLFAQGAAGVGGRAPGKAASASGEPRLLHAQRDQVEFRSFDLDGMLTPDHPARDVWAFVQVLDLKVLYAQVKSVKGSAGAPAIDPAILMALWLWATIDGVGSAREIDRLCDRDQVYQWLCGGVGVNHHTLADFRTAHSAWLDDQLTNSIVALLDRRMVTLQVVAQDGLRVRAAAKASSFRRRDRLLQLQAQAREQVNALKAEVNADAGASSRRTQAARERAAREREQRLAQAVNTMNTMEQRALRKADDKARARSARNKSGGPRAKSAKTSESKTHEAPTESDSKPSEGSKQTQTRVSATDPEARVMKMADGGFRPAFNVQLAVDEATQLIAAIEVVDEGSDMAQMQPMHEQIVQRYGHTPEHWLADGGYPKYEALEALIAHGTQPVVPPAHSRKADSDPLAPKPTDSPALAKWRALMASPKGQALYRRRAASVECVNAQVRRRGLYRFNVCGKLKARAVVLWHALAHNLMRMRSLGLMLAA